MTEQQTSVAPSELEDFLRKYNKGLRIVVEGAQADTGQTPKATVWTKNKAKLYRYEPGKPKKYPVPILIVYALINRPYVLDLIPGNSLIEYLVGEGFDVYMLDWGIPGDEDRDMSFEHYVLDYLPRAVKKVLRISGAEELTLFGYCMGGTMSAMYASLYPETSGTSSCSPPRSPSLGKRSGSTSSSPTGSTSMWVSCPTPSVTSPAR